MMTWLTVTGALLTCAGLIQPQVQRRRIGRGASIPAASSERTRSHPPPARTLPQSISPWRIDVSGSSLPPGVEQFFIRLPIRSNGPEASPSAGGGGISDLRRGWLLAGLALKLTRLKLVQSSL